MKEGDGEPDDEVTPKDHIALLPALAMLDSACDLLAKHDLGYKDALDLLKASYIHSVTRKYPNKSIRELTSGDNPPLDMARSTVTNVRSRALELYKKLHTPQIEQFIRRACHADTPTIDGQKRPSGKTRDELFKLTKASPNFAKMRAKDLTILFNLAFERLTEDKGDTGLEPGEQPGRWLPRSNAAYTKTEAIDAELKQLGLALGNRPEDPVKAAALEVLERANANLAGDLTSRVMRSLSEILEANFINPARGEYVGIQSTNFSIPPEKIPEVHSIWGHHIYPLIERLNDEADAGAKENQKPARTARISIIWTHDIPKEELPKRIHLCFRAQDHTIFGRRCIEDSHRVFDDVIAAGKGLAGARLEVLPALSFVNQIDLSHREAEADAPSPWVEFSIDLDDEVKAQFDQEAFATLLNEALPTMASVWPRGVVNGPANKDLTAGEVVAKAVEIDRLIDAAIRRSHEKPISTDE